MADQHVLFRSDSKKALGLVSEKYKVVQPSEVIEFFRDLARAGDAQVDDVAPRQAGGALRHGDRTAVALHAWLRIAAQKHNEGRVIHAG
jgi:hypothetical protein